MKFNPSDLANLDIQGAINQALDAAHADQYVKSATYLAKDAPAPAGTFVLSLRDPQGEKIEIAIEPAGPLVGMVASLGLKLL